MGSWTTKRVDGETMAKRKKKGTKKKKGHQRMGAEGIVEAPLHRIPENQDIPVSDFLEDYDLDTESGVVLCVEDLIHSIEGGYFLRWEAVAREEQGLPLTGKQREALGELIDFSGNDDGFIHYIDGMPRPSEPWYEIVKEVAPRLVLSPFTTYGLHDEIYHEGWPRLVECLETHAKDLSLPVGVVTPIDAIPAGTRHDLQLQCCFDALSGIGQEEELTLENEDQRPWRVREFIDALKECKDSVNYHGLDLARLFELVKLPPRDERIMVESMQDELGIGSVTEKLYDAL